MAAPDSGACRVGPLSSPFPTALSALSFRRSGPQFPYLQNGAVTMSTSLWSGRDSEFFMGTGPRHHQVREGGTRSETEARSGLASWGLRLPRCPWRPQAQSASQNATCSAPSQGLPGTPRDVPEPGTGPHPSPVTPPPAQAANKTDGQNPTGPVATPHMVQGQVGRQEGPGGRPLTRQMNSPEALSHSWGRQSTHKGGAGRGLWKREVTTLAP